MDPFRLLASGFSYPAAFWRDIKGRSPLVSVMRRICLGFLIAFWIGAPSAAGATTFLVFPLENQTRLQALNWIGEGMAIAISEAAHTPGVDAIGRMDRIRFVEASDLPPNAPLSRASMIRVAQRAAADRLIFGSYSGTEKDLRITLRVLEIKTLRLSGEKVANGPESALPMLENELAWQILSDSRTTGLLTRADFRSRTRRIPNKVYASYLEALAATDDIERVDILLKTIELYHDFPQASYQLGYYYYQKGDIGRAIQYLKPALQESQDYLEAQFMLGTCFLKQGNLMEAIASYNAFLARRPALEAFNNIGVAYLRTGDYPLAVQNLIEARKLSGEDLSVALNLALLRHLEGDEQAALAILEELAKTHGGQGMVHYLYSLALASSGDGPKASAEAAQARQLGIDPELMKRQDPRGWAWIFPAWTRRPALPRTGGSAGAESGTQNRYRH